MSGIDNYNFTDKNKWRESIWNSIRNRFPEKRDRENAVILYLAGEQNIDSELAVKHGFNLNNMIACEIDENTTSKLRKKKVNVIKEDIFDVMSCWGDTPKVDLVVCDLCCGLNIGHLFKMHSILAKKAFLRSVFMFNFQRGRDPDIHLIKKHFSGGINNQNLDCLTKRNIDLEKHRGYMFFKALPLLTMAFAVANKDKFAQYFHPKPSFWTYKSTAGVLRMDSVIFENIMTKTKKLNYITDPYKAIKINSSLNHIWTHGMLLTEGLTSVLYMEENNIPFADDVEDDEEDEERELLPVIEGNRLSNLLLEKDEDSMRQIKQHIAPALAIRTMRMNRKDIRI